MNSFKEIVAAVKTFGIPFSDFGVITKNQAEYIVKNSNFNRPLNKSHVAKIKDDMDSGRWHLNGESVIFWYRNGKPPALLDGQHRMAAFLQSKLEELPTCIALVDDKEAQKHMGCHLPRSLGDTLSLNKIKYSLGTASALKRAFILERAHAGRVTYASAMSPPPTREALQELFIGNEKIVDSVAKAMHKGFPTSSHVAAVHYLICKYTPAATPLADLYVDIMTKGTPSNSEKDAPLFVRSEILKSNNKAIMRDPSSLLYEYRRVPLIVWGWYWFSHGKPVPHKPYERFRRILESKTDHLEVIDNIFSPQFTQDRVNAIGSLWDNLCRAPYPYRRMKDVPSEVLPK